MKALFETETILGYKLSIIPSADGYSDQKTLDEATSEYEQLMPGYKCEVFEKKGDNRQRLLLFRKS